jgi:hypothetical protein
MIERRASQGFQSKEEATSLVLSRDREIESCIIDPGFETAPSSSATIVIADRSSGHRCHLRSLIRLSGTASWRVPGSSHAVQQCAGNVRRPGRVRR